LLPTEVVCAVPGAHSACIAPQLNLPFSFFLRSVVSVVPLYPRGCTFRGSDAGEPFPPRGLSRNAVSQIQRCCLDTPFHQLSQEFPFFVLGHSPEMNHRPAETPSLELILSKEVVSSFSHPRGDPFFDAHLARDFGVEPSGSNGPFLLPTLRSFALDPLQDFPLKVLAA